ncbi:hypothetical protein N7G274_002223 [Stereocaulon virgatum]|uniref:DUF218 domain-containing protein n=1 Tax=Stereocaulon virgatum TaxID=373712 RepID=A0ABR4AHA3_9LECA
MVARKIMAVNHLILVCCHTIWLGGGTKGENEDEWAIETFQKGETPTFMDHIKAGIQVLNEQPDSILVFSGGATKRDRTPLSEGESYLNLARTLAPPTLHPSLAAETHATDSYQNILFSIIHYHHLTTRYPTHITLITHAFKILRFLDLHVRAIRWPSDRITFLGIDPPEQVTPRTVLEEGKGEGGYGVWKGDLYGVGDILGGKRRARGWVEESLRVVGEGVEEGVWRLLGWRGGESGVEVYLGRLPWDEGGDEGRGSGS